MLALGMSTAWAQTPLLSGTTPSAFSLMPGSYGNGSIVAVTGMPFSQAWQVNVTGTAPNFQSVTLTATTTSSVAEGDVIIATFYYRRTDTISDELNVTAYFQQVGGAAADSIVIPLRGRGQWRKISIPFIANSNYATGGADFFFALSAQVQSVQISGVNLADYGQKSLLLTGVTDASSQFVFSGSTGQTIWATETKVPVTGNPFFTTASHIPVTTTPGTDSYVNLAATNRTVVSGSDTLVAVFWVRDADTPAQNAVVGMATLNSTGTAVVTYQQNALIVDANWKQHIIPFTTGSNYAANAMLFELKCAAELQTVEYGGLQLLDLGPSVNAATLTSTVNDYPGRLLSDTWRAVANASSAKPFR